MKMIMKQNKTSLEVNWDSNENIELVLAGAARTHAPQQQIMM